MQFIEPPIPGGIIAYRRQNISARPFSWSKIVGFGPHSEVENIEVMYEEATNIRYFQLERHGSFTL